jgi:hypothetical protein
MNTGVDFLFNKKLFFPGFVDKYRCLNKDHAPRHKIEFESTKKHVQ